MLNSLNEPTRCRNHSRATKIGARMWKRNELCSNGVPWRSRMRKRIRPSSDSSISSLRRAKLTRAAFTTERSSPSRRRGGRSRDRGRGSWFSGMTSVVTATKPSLAGLYVGTSGWSYPSWKGGFYPAGTEARASSSRFYSERFPTRRAEHDRLPAAGGGAVRALGRADAGRVPLRGQDAARTGCDRRRRSGARAAAR